MIVGGVTCDYAYGFFVSSRRRHTRLVSDWSSDVCSSDLAALQRQDGNITRAAAELGVSRKTLRAWMRQEGLYPSADAGRAVEPAGIAESPAEYRDQQSDDGVDGLMAALPMGEVEATSSVSRSAAETAAPIVSASASDIHWERRWVALLRVSLAVAPEEAPQDTTRPLETIADKIQTFGGRVTELGRTGLEGAFGLDPLEDAAQRAAYAALAIQRARARDGSALIPARIALHADSYLVGHMATSTQIDQDAKRSASALLETMISTATPDEVVVSHTALSFLRRHFAFDRPLLAGPAGQVYRLLGRADRPAAFDRQISSFVGRESEMGLLGHLWALARQGLGQVVGVVGDPGIGKSRLIWEFLRREVTSPSLVLETACAAL